MIQIIVGVIAACVGLCFASRSVYLAVLFERPFPYSDQWVFIQDYFRFLDGTYRFANIVGQHNEHRPLAGRVVLFADAYFFHMNGWLPLLVQYATLAATAAIIAKLATTTSRQFVAAFCIALGAMCSISQYENLSWSFQTPFAFVHFFAALTLVALSNALTGKEPLKFLALALVCDFLAVTNIASGLLIVAPAILLAIWLRKLDRRILMFCAGHACIMAWYFWGYRPGVNAIPDFVTGLHLVVGFVGIPFRDNPEIAPGITCLAALLLACGWVLAITRPLDRNAAILLALAVFSLFEGAVASVLRDYVSLRYCTISIVLWSATIAFYFRTIDRPLARVGLAIASLIVVIGCNSLFWAREWSHKAQALEVAMSDLQAAKFDKIPQDFLSPVVPIDVVKRYREWIAR